MAQGSANGGGGGVQRRAEAPSDVETGDQQREVRTLAGFDLSDGRLCCCCCCCNKDEY